MSQVDELPAPKKKKSKLKWFILLLLLLGLGGGGFMVYKMGLVDKFLGGDDAQQADAGAAGNGAIGSGNTGSTRITTPTSDMRTATFDQFVTNLSDPAGNRYIRLIIDVEVISPEVIRELETQNPRIRDSILMLLSSKSFQDLNSPAGKLRLKNEILDRINQVLGGPKVNRVFFTEIFVQ
ncbi:MAG: flagellar basal body-associated FliL family protein [Deltaproteobacteria bacterium]|jgi:flagellar FliL protein|nr:flagellar basal body-associated FliL family protein [Deltaproteobacteria bacterium]